MTKHTRLIVLLLAMSVAGISAVAVALRRSGPQEPGRTIYGMRMLYLAQTSYQRKNGKTAPNVDELVRAGYVDPKSREAVSTSVHVLASDSGWLLVSLPTKAAPLVAIDQSGQLWVASMAQ